MPGLDPGIHVLAGSGNVVDPRGKPGGDDSSLFPLRGLEVVVLLAVVGEVHALGDFVIAGA